jgi:hypothetical protein
MIRTSSFGMFSLLVLTCIACGGGGGSSSSFTAGKYNGSLSDPGRASIVIELSVSGDGSLSGKSTVVSAFSGAIVGVANIAGTVDTNTRTFVATGDYVNYLPPPPGGGGAGSVRVTGTIPASGVPTGPIQVENNTLILNGVISLFPLI